MISKQILLTTLLLSAAVSLRATDYYVAPSPTPTGNGSMSSPWDLQTALHATGTVRPGDTIWVRGGTHRLSFTDGSGVFRPMPTKFDSTLTGAAGNNITVRAYPGERATIDGNLQQKSGGYVTFWGLEIMDSTPGRYTTQAGPFPTTWWITQNGKQADFCVSGVDIGGNTDQGAPWVPGMKFINCVVHDNIGGGFGLSRSSAGIQVYGCLVYYNGWRGYNTATYAPQNHGHGFYIQHAGTTQTVIKNTFSYQNYSQGAQYYGTTAGYADYGTYDGVAMWQNSHFQATQQRNMEYGNAAGVACMNPTIANCMVYDTRGSGSDSEFGDGSGMNYMTFTNNYFGTMVNFMGPFLNTVALSGNTFAAGVSGTINSGNTASYPNNTYGWAQPTSGTKIGVYANDYEAGRGNIVIFNWGNASTVTVDISKVGLAVGDTYELHQADDYYNDVTTGTYNGSPITINMTGHTVAAPVGYSVTGNADSQVLTQPSTFPTFGSFVIMKKSGSTTPSNTAPTVTSISNQTIQQGSTTTALSFTVADAQTAASSLTVTATSGNTTLVPNANIAIGGSGSSRTVTVTPAAGQTGTAAITVAVSDGSLSTTTSFNVTVQAVNTAPTITSVAAQSIPGGSSTGPLTFTVGDAQTAAGSLTVTATSGNTTLVPNANIVLGGSSSRTVTVTPAAGQLGTAAITLTVTDGSLTASTTFNVTVVNTAPTISSVNAQSIQAGSSTGPLAFTVGDAQTAAGSLVVTATSSDLTLIPASGIALGGSGASRTVTITPGAGKSGTATITLSVSDGSLTANSSFSVTVAANLPPTISAIPNQTIAQGSNSAAIAFTVSDATTAAANLVVTAASSNPTLIPASGLVLGGSGSSRTITIKPAAAQSGQANVTVSVSDGIASTNTSFAVTVTATTSTNPPSQLVALGFEAESCTIVAPMTVATDSTMPTRKFIQTTTANSGTATFNVNIPVAGTYVMWCKVLAPSYTNDSFFVSVDGAEDVFDEAEGKQSPNWQWSQVNGRNGTGVPNTLNPRTFNLTTGQHTIVFRGREAYAMIDRVILVNSLSYVPMEVTGGNDNVSALPNVTNQIDPTVLLANDRSAFSDPLTISAVSLAQNGTVTLANGMISYVPKAGFVGQDTFTYTVTDGMGGNGTATVTVNVQGSTAVRLGFEAESGALITPMGATTMVTAGAATASATIATTTSPKFISSTIVNQGTATYNLNVPKTGTYVLWCKVLAPTYTNDSFFVSVDGAEDVFDAAEGKDSPNWQWSVLNGRNGTGVPLTLNPRKLSLTAGVHTVVFRGREAGTALDRLILTDDLTFVPQDLVATADSVSAFANVANTISATTLTSNDYSLFGDSFKITNVSVARNGTTALNSSSITYTPKAGFTGQDTFGYTITDSEGNSASATVTVTVK